MARTGYIPDISASLSVSYIGDGFTTKRDFSDYSKAPIPHLGTGLSLNVNQPLYTGCAFTYYTFALSKWRYKTMTAIALALAIVYLGYFYFYIDYGLEKEMLFIPLFFRGAASVIISIVFLTSIVQSGLPFTVFPQALTINGFTGAVMGATFGPAVIGELLRSTVTKNASLLSANIVDFNHDIAGFSVRQLYGLVQLQALLESMKEIYGWLLITALVMLLIILVSYSPVRPWALFPKWRSERRMLWRIVRTAEPSV